MNNQTKKPALGRGLSALLESVDTDITSKGDHVSGTVGSIAMLPIESIEANPFNPRTNFEREALIELSESIRLHGIIQPLTVRKLGRDKYQLISGERRFRASQLAGLTEIPAYIRIANDQAMLELALVENIQREDLNPIEVALSFERLIEECSLTQDQLSQKVSKSRSNITNYLRLLKLPAEVQLGVREGKLSMGHARALVSAGNEDRQIELYHRIINENLTVRDIEKIIRGEEPNPDPDQLNRKNPQRGLNLSETEFTLKEFLADRLSTKVEIRKSHTGKGKISLNFNSDVDLLRILELLKK